MKNTWLPNELISDKTTDRLSISFLKSRIFTNFKINKNVLRYICWGLIKTDIVTLQPVGIFFRNSVYPRGSILHQNFTWANFMSLNLCFINILTTNIVDFFLLKICSMPQCYALNVKSKSSFSQYRQHLTGSFFNKNTNIVFN